MNYFHFPVNFGTILISWNSNNLLSRIEWSDGRFPMMRRIKVPVTLERLVEQLRGYFYQGEPIEAVPWNQLDQVEWSDFQREVFYTISRIPHGETRTYGWVAAQLGKSTASRAVGQALKNNPLPILIPCHRILAATSIGGFMGAVDATRPELHLKRWLMKLEEEYRNPIFSFLASRPSWTSPSQISTS